MLSKGVASILVSIFIALWACAPKPSTVIPEVKNLPQAVVPSGVAESWQATWESVQKGARKEGKLVLYSGVGTDVREAFTDALKEYGVSLDFLGGRSVELQEKVSRERRAGIYNVDFFMTGIGTMFPMKPFSLPPESLMILPEVKDPSLWYKGDLNFLDKERLLLVFIAYLDQGIHVNTDIVKPGEIKSMQDLLSPKWKGKIIIDDPTLIGRGQTFLEQATIRLGEDYINQLVKQEPVTTRDVRQVAEFVAKGRYPIGLGVRPDPYQEFKRAGAPIANIYLEEVANLASGVGNVAYFDKAPNPNASRVFLNWLLSKKGQTAWQEIRMDQSARRDISVENLVKAGLPVRKEGVDYFDVRSEKYQTGEEATKARNFVIKTFAALLK